MSHIHLKRWRGWCVSTEPEFAAKAAAINSPYMSPPENAIVLCVDKKPHIQALEPAQGYLRLPNCRALRGYAHEYKRHGATTLFAALDVASGQVKAGHNWRRRRRELLDFMNEVIGDYRPGLDIHASQNYLKIHKPKRDQWRAPHNNVHFHFTPTHTSWLNQIEIWFSIMARAALKGDSFTSTQQVRDAINAFITAQSTHAAPLRWRMTLVYQGHLEQRYAALRKYGLALRPIYRSRLDRWRRLLHRLRGTRGRTPKRGYRAAFPPSTLST